MFIKNKSKVAIAVISILSTMIAPHAFAENNDSITKKDKEKEIEVITVTGIKGSISKSLSNKRYSTEIMDSISAEDIGQLPDANIAEALQRVTGIQMTRDANGEGSTVQIRGISDNNVEINGQTTAGTGADRSVNFADIPSELFAGIEVLKAPTADRIEGSLGGTINLKTRRPLNIQEEQFATVTAKAKYSELSGETTPDFNVFLGKNWRDTAMGDFGVIINGGRRETITSSDAFSGSWYRQNGGKNGAAPFNSGPWETDPNVDVNGDGVSDDKDIFYVPSGIVTRSGYTESESDSFNVTLNWQPNDDLDLFFDYTKTDSTVDTSGATINMGLNGGRALPLLQGDNTFTHLGNNAEMGDVYVLSSGLVGGANIRMGGAPSQKTVWRDADKITLGGDYIINDNWLVSAEVNTSEGTSTSKQAQLNMGYDWNKDSQLNAKDWAGILHYDINNVDLYDYTLYEAPFYDGAGPVTPGELVAIDPTNMAYDRLNYFQMQRNAVDTNSTDNSVKLDFEYEIDDGFISDIKFGVRVAERSFERQDYINPNQKKTVQGEDGKFVSIDIQDVKVDPDANTDPAMAQIATDLQQCFGTSSVDFDGVSGNFARSWSNTNNCGSDFFTDHFNMYDIRSFDEALGKGRYESAGARFDVEEETIAYYIRADYMTEIAGMDLTGNFGVRYIETETTSSGYLRSAPGSAATFEWVSFIGVYDDFLPSFNANLALNDEMMLRFAAYKALSRPGLGALAPSVNIKYNDDLEGYAGNGTMGNPDLDPVRATNIDLSYEWYYASDSMFSIAAFYKDIDSTIAMDYENPQDIEINDELFFVNQQGNLPGTKIKGLELGLQHGFSNLPGLLAHTGLGANYTFISEDSDMIDQEGDQVTRVGLSEHSYNLAGYYDDGTFSIRLAYNWRDDFVARQNVTLGWNSPNLLPEIEEARGQLDITANYQVTKALKINFSAVNINDSETKRFLKYEQLHSYLAQSGPRYQLGAVYRF